MDDIVKRLRLMVRRSYLLHMGKNMTDTVREAADEIERLRRELAEAKRKCLGCGVSMPTHCDVCHHYGRGANNE